MVVRVCDIEQALPGSVADVLDADGVLQERLFEAPDLIPPHKEMPANKRVQLAVGAE